MSVPPAKPEGLSVSVVGAGGLEIQELLLRLEECPLVGKDILRMSYSESPGSGGSVSGRGAWEDEDLLPPLDLDEVGRADMVFLGEGGAEVRRRVIEAAGEGNTWAVDLGAEPGEGPWTRPGDPPEKLRSSGHCLRLPEPVAALLALLSGPLEEMQVSSIAVQRLLPASSRGEEGVRDLHRQATALLSFQKPPEGVLRGQWAFNVLQETRAEESNRFVKQVRSLWDNAPPVACATFFASVYHSTLLNVAIATGVPAASAERIAGKRLADSDAFRVWKRKRSFGAQDAVQETVPLVSFRSDGDSWLWLTLAFDNVKAGRPAHALKVLEALAR